MGEIAFCHPACLGYLGFVSSGHQIIAICYFSFLKASVEMPVEAKALFEHEDSWECFAIHQFPTDIY